MFIGGGPASLAVARDLAPLGYEIHLFDEQIAGGGMMRSQIPAFRLPAAKLLAHAPGYLVVQASYRAAGAAVPIPGTRQQTVLAMLLLEPGRVVPSERLYTALWDDQPPSTARTRPRGVRKGIADTDQSSV